MNHMPLEKNIAWFSEIKKKRYSVGWRKRRKPGGNVFEVSDSEWFLHYDSRL